MILSAWACQLRRPGKRNSADSNSHLAVDRNTAEGHNTVEARSTAEARNTGSEIDIAVAHSIVARSTAEERSIVAQCIPVVRRQKGCN